MRSAPTPHVAVPSDDAELMRRALARDDFRGDSSLATWLSRITMNEALGRLRRQRPAVDLETFEAQQFEGI